MDAWGYICDAFEFSVAILEEGLLYVFDSFFCSSCILKFWNGIWFEIIINKITEASWCKFSCPLDWTTKLPFSRLPQAIACVFVFVCLFVFSFLLPYLLTLHIFRLWYSLMHHVKENQHFFAHGFHVYHTTV